ncbi:MAG TPA: cupin domain-containing protein [Ktedonobacteraceae bacterium]|nr:cupin domain-containing protein [Ktedonobacteraceae bacterium]
MKIIKKPGETVPREDAHGGSGGRRLYVSDSELENADFQAMTYGFLPPKAKFVWHNHEGIEEIMLVLKGKGIVRDRDGEYPYKEGDLFIYPQNIEHEIENTGDEEHEYIFIRTKV